MYTWPATEWLDAVIALKDTKNFFEDVKSFKRPKIDLFIELMLDSIILVIGGLAGVLCVLDWLSPILLIFYLIWNIDRYLNFSSILNTDMEQVIESIHFWL